ncbi:hypothetical protein LSUE1_G010241, partial [Lachnellula suecica]
WQKASAAEVIVDPLADAVSVPEVWENEEESVDEEERLRIKFRKDNNGGGGGATAPKKRVISDSHWRKKSPPRKGIAIPKNFLQATAINPPLEKKIQDWVKRTEGDETEAEKPRDKPRSRKVSKQDVADRRSGNSTPDRVRGSPAGSFDDGIRVRPLKHSSRDDASSAPSSNYNDDGIRVGHSKRRPKGEQKDSQDDGIRVTPSKSRSRERDSRKRNSNPPSQDQDDGIRIKPSREKSDQDDGIRIKASKEKSNQGDRIRIKPSREQSEDDSIRIKPVRKSASKRPPQEDSASEVQTPTKKKSERNLRVPSESRSKRVPSSHATSDHGEEDDQFSWVTPNPVENSKRRQRKSSQTPPESLADVPFGDSAFSVLELPLGAEAGTMKRPPPKRNPSFSAVPKVLKKVFNEGMKIAHDTVEPPRGGTNKPPSIESWLNNTTDPFVDQPSSSKLDVPDSPGRRRSYKEDDPSERDLTSQHESERNESRWKRRVHSAQETIPEETSPNESRKTRDTLPSMENSPPMSPTGLKRTPATRNITSPKSARKVPLKDAFIDAFRGESTTTRPKSVSNPFIDITGLRERDVNRNSPDPLDFKSSRDSDYMSEERKSSPRESTEETKRDKPLPSISRRPPPTTGGHRLSTIASVETFSTLSSLTGTDSQLSQTTVTQATVLTAPTNSSLSRNSHKSKNLGSKRRLTKHSDLVSVLSLPDAVEPAATTSIKSARSIRTNRTRLEVATTQDLMRELAEDEAKYTQELNTLVGGVIPVLLTCVLSKSDSAIASGLFDPHSDSSTTDPSFTKPIVDMGVALEQLKSLHKRIPLTDPNAFVTWAMSAHRTYSDYLAAWRAGFNDVVVNLAPAAPNEQADIDVMPRDKNGDVLGANGQRADVSYFLKRPLVRIKYLEKVVKGLDTLLMTEKSRTAKEKYHDLLQASRQRHKEENARLEDNRANNTDTTKARDLKTLAPAEGTTIDRSRQVQARDLFLLDLPHTSGNRITSHIELFFRDKSGGDLGDILICETDSKPFLLFPPIAKENISARSGDKPGQLVIMIRGEISSEVLTLDAEEPEAAPEWIEILGTEPVPPAIRTDADLVDHVTSISSAPAGKNEFFMSGGLNTDDIQIPIGEKIRMRGDESAATPKDRRRVSRRRTPPIDLPEPIVEESVVEEEVRDLNDAMNKAGLGTPKRPRAARYHGKPTSPRPTTPGSQQTTPTQSRDSLQDPQSPQGCFEANLPHIPKVRSSSTPEDVTTPVKASLRADLDPVKQRSQSAVSSREEEAPPPPAHKLPLSPSTLKKAPVLDASTPRATNRRSSSPLKHEYQPSISGASDSSEGSDSDDSDSYSSSEDDELELQDVPISVPNAVYPQRVSPKGSIYSLQNSTIAPSQSASQAPYNGPGPAIATSENVDKYTVVGCSYWNDKGYWVDLYPNPCSLHIGPGWLKVFELATPNSSDSRRSEKPLIVQVLTPIVTLAGHTLDIQVRSPLTADSKLHCKSAHIRYRMLTPTDTSRIYNALKESRMRNMFYNAMQEERR